MKLVNFEIVHSGLWFISWQAVEEKYSSVGNAANFRIKELFKSNSIRLPYFFPGAAAVQPFKEPTNGSAAENEPTNGSEPPQSFQVRKKCLPA
jgi:hypothetical protein